MHALPFHLGSLVEDSNVCWVTDPRDPKPCVLPLDGIGGMLWIDKWIDKLI